MFEDAQEQKTTGSTRLWIGIFVVVAVAGLGILYYWISKGSAKSPAPVSASASAAAPTKPDPVKDLKIQRATMQKDALGATAVWLVTIENNSPSYAYSDIKYETDYMGADNKALVVNKGTITINLPPDAEQNAEIRDTAYPTGTAWYNFKITGAKATAQ
ncbi:MAG: hypothetical protein WCE61_05790 [Candidatus Acidiferrum sp.]